MKSLHTPMVDKFSGIRAACIYYIGGSELRVLQIRLEKFWRMLLERKSFLNFESRVNASSL